MIGDRDHPRLNSSVVLAPTEEGYLAFDTESERIHQLNPAAVLVIELCDGSRSLSGVREALVPLLGDAGWRRCRQWIGTARREGLLTQDAAPGRPRSHSATGLTRLAATLLARDEALAAFVCQRQATELAPEDAATWYGLGEIAHAVGRRADARLGYERYFETHPDDEEVEHLLTSLRNEQPPSRASDRCVEQLYERFASFYDESMSRDLEYRGPSLLYEAVISTVGDRAGLDVLDLGCGTGLSGLPFRHRAQRLVGLDLSPAMVERARRRAIYDELITGEITSWLASNRPRRFDLVTACDTLIYIGDLRPVVLPASRLLRSRGLFAFTVELGRRYPFTLADSGRFAHHRDHLTDVAGEADLTVASLDQAVIRYEYGHPVVGLVVVLTKET